MRVPHRILLLTVAWIGVASLAGVPAAVAADPSPAPAGHEWGLTFGVDATSQYIFRGLANSEGPAVQPWAEITAGPLYFGYWGSNVSPSLIPGAHWENDLSVGVRPPKLGPVSLDVGYVRYVYDTGYCCSELYVIAKVNPVEPLTVGGSIWYDPEFRNTYVEGTATLVLRPKLEASGAVANQAYGTGIPDVFSWNAGLTWKPHDWLGLDGRYYAGPTADKFVFTLSLSSSWAALKEHQKGGEKKKEGGS